MRQAAIGNYPTPGKGRNDVMYRNHCAFWIKRIEQMSVTMIYDMVDSALLAKGLNGIRKVPR